MVASMATRKETRKVVLTDLKKGVLSAVQRVVKTVF